MTEDEEATGGTVGQSDLDPEFEGAEIEASEPGP